MTLADHLAAIRAAPPGPQTGAFFDFDGTLIDGYSALALMQERARRLQIGPHELAGLVLVTVKGAAGQSDFNELMTVGLRGLAGRPREDLDRLGEHLARSSLGGSLYGDAVELVAEHHRQGHTVVVASSALPFQIEPLARELEIEHVLCTRPHVIDGVYDGTVDGAILWGAAKADAIAAFAADRKVDLEESFAYANGDEDIEFLATVGRPCAVNPKPELERMAAREGWPTARFHHRGAGLRDTARTVAAYAGMAAGFGVGAGIGLLNRDRRQAANLSISLGSDVALSLAGVSIDVTGEANLWAQRPAVFIFNHQSWLDGLVVMKLLRGDITGVAKKEVANQPGFGQFARLANMAFIDRADGVSARKALEPAVERIHEGYSIAIAPEGTRSTTPRVGPFKKGAFHLAMQGGVPVVPIVIRNAGELLWRGSSVIKTGTVDVIVHEPIDVRHWKRNELGEQVERVHALFVDTLAQWDAARGVVG
jgi:HAD superfamily hydrolase (TIGR01490 family)